MPAQVKIAGATDLRQTAPSLTEVLVDVQRQANRFSISPLDYAGQGSQVLGHYKASQASGATVSLAAAAHIASFRWTDLTRYAVLLKIRVGYTITGAITAATPMDLQAVMARQFTVDFSGGTGRVQLNMGTVARTGALRSFMSTSILGSAGPQIAGSTAMSGQTFTADNAPIALTVFPNILATNVTGTAVTQSVGCGAPMQTLFACDAWGEHPIVLAANEGVVIQNLTAGPTTGSVKYYVEWTWAELAGF